MKRKILFWLVLVLAAPAAHAQLGDAAIIAQLKDLNKSPAGLARENLRLQVINNRMLHELIVQARFQSLLAAQADLRAP